MVEFVVPVPADSDSTGTNPLTSRWVFWYFIPNRTGTVHSDPTDDWSTYLHPLHSFEAVEDFGRIINSVEHPSKLLKGCRYYVFRKDIRPLWEDPAVLGGSIIFVEAEKEPDRSQELESKWIEIVLEVLGSTWLQANSVLGIEYSSQPSTWRIGVWVGAGCPYISDLQGNLTDHFARGVSVHVQPIVKFEE
jgi:translation initiation factor 4E